MSKLGDVVERLDSLEANVERLEAGLSEARAKASAAARSCECAQGPPDRSAPTQPAGPVDPDAIVWCVQCGEPDRRRHVDFVSGSGLYVEDLPHADGDVPCATDYEYRLVIADDPGSYAYAAYIHPTCRGGTQWDRRAT